MVYLILNADQGFCKIGYSRSPEKRLCALQNGNPYELMLVSVIEGDKSVEKKLHNMFSHLRMEGEWFMYSDSIQEYFGAPEMIYICVSNKFSKEIAPYINSPTSWKLLFWLLFNEMNKNNVVNTGAEVWGTFNAYLKKKCGNCEIAYRTFNSCIEELLESGALTRIGRGRYYLNPHIFWKTGKKDRIKFIEAEMQNGKIVSPNPVKQIEY